MSLITPLFLLGMLGIALPWWLHRLETQTTEREKFATTRFLEPSKKRIHVQRKLRYLLLMALRMLFLALLAFAFARPILLEDPAVVATEESTHHIIVVDTSFSMREGDKMQQARDRARSILDNMGDDDIASLYTASTTVTTLAEPTGNANTVIQLLPTISANNGHLDFGAMVSALNGLVEKSQARFVLHLFSDFQQSSQAVRFADMIPDVINGRPVTLDVQQIGTEVVANFAVASVLIENRSDVIASVRAFNGSIGAAEKQLTLTVNGVVQQTLPLPPTSNNISTVVFKDVVFAEGDNRVNVAMSPNDTLPDDDVRYTVFDNAPPAPVLLLTENTGSLGVTYLTAALETAPRGYAVEPTSMADFDARVLQRYPWLIIEDIGAVSGGLAAALNDYVNGGGAIFAGIGPKGTTMTTVPVLNTTMSFPAANSNQLTPPPITQIDTSHPALNRSNGWNNVNARVMKVNTTRDDRVLISQTADLPVLIERNVGAGRIMLFTSSLDNSASDLPVKPVFVSFMAEVAQYLSNEKLLVKEQVADSYLQLSQTGGASGQVVNPEGVNLLSLQDTTLAQDVLLNLTGYYQVFTPAGEVLVAVNPDIRESDLSLIPAQTLQTWQASVAGAAGTSRLATGDTQTATVAEDAIEIEIWRFFLILMVLLILAESLLGNRYLNFKTGTF